MSKQSKQFRISELESLVKQARSDYYNSNPTVTDEVFDAWVDELKELQADNPQVTSIGSPPVSAWTKASHTIPMGSLDKVQTMEEMIAWVKKVSRKNINEELIVTEKLDGISINLRYFEGKLIQAITRGDGQVGEDITSNVVRMKGVLKQLPEPISVTYRGEIVLFKEDLIKHFPDTSNTRNAASGTAKRLDGSNCEHLTVLLYQALDGPEFSTEEEQFKFLERMGFKVPFWAITYRAPGKKTPIDLWNEYQESLRETLPYDIDGLVVRLNDLAYQMSLGETNGRPLGAVAFKFSPVTRETVATDIIYQVGGTGRITPVAVFEPINLCGAEVKRASLYNQAYIEKIGFYVGSKVLVGRSNDVIPVVFSVINKDKHNVSQPPKNCPECGTPTTRDGEYIICPNSIGCPAQTEGRITQWIKELGIMEWGSSLVHKVVECGLVKTVPDLYRLKADQLEELERMGETSAEKAINQLWGVIPVSLAQFLGGLSIPLCATSTIQVIIDAGYNSLEDIRNLSMNQLINMYGVGPKRAESLYNWMKNNVSLIDDLLNVGVTIKERAMGNLTGKSVCFTGKSNLTRAELIELAENAGGTVKKSVGKGLTYLVMADPNSTTTKAQAARKLGTTCISEDDFIKMVM